MVPWIGAALAAASLAVPPPDPLCAVAERPLRYEVRALRFLPVGRVTLRLTRQPPSPPGGEEAYRALLELAPAGPARWFTTLRGASYEARFRFAEGSSRAACERFVERSDRGEVFETEHRYDPRGRRWSWLRRSPGGATESGTVAAPPEGDFDPLAAAATALRGGFGPLAAGSRFEFPLYPTPWVDRVRVEVNGERRAPGKVRLRARLEGRLFGLPLKEIDLTLGRDGVPERIRFLGAPLLGAVDARRESDGPPPRASPPPGLRAP